MSNLERLIKELNDAVREFNSSLSVIESGVLAEVELLIKELNISNGSIVADVSNLSKINRIRAAIDNVVISPEYTQRVIDFGRAYNKVAEIQGQYFAELIENYTAPEVLDQIKKASIDEMVMSLTESGISANVSDKIGSLIQESIETGGRYTDLTIQLRDFITGTTETAGALERYASQITTDGINQFAATYNKTVSDDLGLEWYMYVGSLVGDSRDLCEALISKKFIHKSELSEVVKGRVNGKQVPIYPKTGLPYGMIPGTNASNFQVRRGGYRCNHLLMPVPEERVPIEIRNKIKVKDKIAAMA
jgi:hypothetical protein